MTTAVVVWTEPRLLGDIEEEADVGCEQCTPAAVCMSHAIAMSSVGCSACHPPTSSTACFRYIVLAPENGKRAP
jgi:hypothetical protein